MTGYDAHMSAAVSQQWSCPGQTRLCPQLRRRTRRALCPFPRIVDDAELVMAELFANACRHSRSGTGGATVINISALPSELVLLSVTDEGPRPRADGRPLRPHLKPLDSTAPGHRGLRLVAALADDWGHWPTGEGGNAVWALFEPSTTVSTARLDPLSQRN
ncbi:ATP-binding protein [Salinactinospora qingdaonensis]|uniref:Histidine kinase/HSP90-like ATPase domain-containing protein n=1 Tax=Salinactinospora qingdaonensis TaxID=702744 RepID=A0ABP7G0N9_9ACTN